MSNDLFQFEWPVDQAGYEVRHHPAVVGATLLGSSPERDEVVPRGGSPRFYRPLADQPGLWRQFSEACTDESGVLAFANEFGLLVDRWHNSPRDFIESATVIGAMAARLDQNDRPAAAEIFNEYARPYLNLAAGIRPDSLKFEIVPHNLKGALFLQTMQVITGTTAFRRCKNCPTWFPYGQGTGATARKEFCSTRCRVAFNRRLVATS